MERYSVRISKDYLVFSASHFITYGDGECERLHGHDYRLAAEVHGPLDDDLLVVDFIALRDTLKRIVEELDHRVLLAAESPALQTNVGQSEVEVRSGDRRWIFPRADCLLLPIANTTTEMLARHIGLRLAEELRSQTGVEPTRVRIELDECQGQVATWED